MPKTVHSTAALQVGKAQPLNLMKHVTCGSINLKPYAPAVCVSVGSAAVCMDMAVAVFSPVSSPAGLSSLLKEYCLGENRHEIFYNPQTYA